MSRRLPLFGALFRILGIGTNDFAGYTVRADVLHGETGRNDVDLKNRMDVVHGALNPVFDVCEYQPGCVHVEYAGRAVCLRDGDKAALESQIHNELIQNLGRFNVHAPQILGRI